MKRRMTAGAANDASTRHVRMVQRERVCGSSAARAIKGNAASTMAAGIALSALINLKAAL